MSVHDEIRAAVGAHEAWKRRLHEAIDTGKSDVPTQTVRADNQCKFGQWLYGTTLPAPAKLSPSYQECRELHAKSHVAALGEKSEFMHLSDQLTQAMMRWQKTAA